MEKVSLEKLRQSWIEFGDLLHRMEKSGNFTTLDLDLLRQKLAGFYEELLQIQPESNGNSRLQDFHSKIQNISKAENHVEISIQSAETIGGRVIQAEPSELESSEVPITNQSREEFTTERPAPPLIIKEEKAPKEKAHARTEEYGTQIIGEKFQDQRKLVHDELAAKVHAGKKDLTASLQSQPIENIEKAIGINDKFLFIKELFSNNGVLYKETVEHLNHCKNLDEAMQFIHVHFEWSAEDPVVEKFLGLVKRRHG